MPGARWESVIGTRVTWRRRGTVLKVSTRNPSHLPLGWSAGVLMINCEMGGFLSSLVYSCITNNLKWNTLSPNRITLLDVHSIRGRLVCPCIANVKIVW